MDGGQNPMAMLLQKLASAIQIDHLEMLQAGNPRHPLTKLQPAPEGAGCIEGQLETDYFFFEDFFAAFFFPPAFFFAAIRGHLLLTEILPVGRLYAAAERA
jgi:hypothetical protein